MHPSNIMHILVRCNLIVLMNRKLAVTAVTAVLLLLLPAVTAVLLLLLPAVTAVLQQQYYGYCCQQQQQCYCSYDTKAVTKE